MQKFYLLFLSVFSISAFQIMAKETPKKVLISKVISHPALDITVKGIMDGLDQSGYKNGLNLTIRVESAQANSALASQIAVNFINQNPDVVVGVGTLSAQSFLKYTNLKKVKMVFSSITDPLLAKLVENLNKPGNNVSGVSNFVALEPQIKLFQTIQPNLKRLGILYNNGELNSVSIVKRLEELCPKFGIKLIKQTANKTSDVTQAVTKLVGEVDAIFISNDNTALGALQNVVMVANKAKIPVYVSDTDSLTLGALAALGPNQYQVGLQTGKMIARVLNGEEIGLMPVEFPNKTDLSLNEDEAQILGFHFPDALKRKAAQVIRNNP